MNYKNFSGCDSFLKKLKKHVSEKELIALAMEAGFVYPNNFPIQKIIDIINSGKMPQDDLEDYIWAIYECNYERLQLYSPWVKAFISSIYVHSYKLNQSGVCVQSDYFFLGVKAALQDETGELAGAFLEFINWLNYCVTPDDGYEDQYAWIAWIFLKKIMNEENSNDYKKIINYLSERNYTSEMIDTLDVSTNREDSWWSLFAALQKEISEEALLKKIIFGI
jgi:hypothetical protein